MIGREARTSTPDGHPARAAATKSTEDAPEGTPDDAAFVGRTFHGEAPTTTAQSKGEPGPAPSPSVRPNGDGDGDGDGSGEGGGGGTGREPGDGGLPPRREIRIKKPPILFRKTQKIVRAIAEKTGGTFLTYWNSPSGSVCADDVQALYGVLESAGHQDTLFLFLKSGGGDPEAALRIVNLLRRFANRVVAMLPLDCASASTMIALGADEIRMGPLSFLTAVDTSLTHELSPVNAFNKRVAVSQDELTRILKLWRAEAPGKSDEAKNPYACLFEHVHPLVFGAVDRSSSLSVKLCREILGFHMKDKAKAEEIAVHLNSAYPSHGYPILLHEASRIGLGATELSSELNELLLDLHELYSEMGQEAVTDYDERNYHNNEILNVIETVGVQLHYQVDKDWHYRSEERQWVPMNDASAWCKVEDVRGRTRRSQFHIR